LASIESVVSLLRGAGCVYAEDEARLLAAAAMSAVELADLVDRRIAGLPLEHILGWAEFCGLRIAVDHGVFVPRQRTEFLVSQAVALLGGTAGAGETAGAGILADAGRRAAVVVDLCCGSGAVGAAIAARVDGIELHASDVEPAAVRCARRNIEPAGGRVHEGDLYDPLPSGLRGQVEVLVANAPYVPTASIGTMPQEARMHEPRISLDGGPDGLDVQRRVVAGAPEWLAPGGHLLIETSLRQAPRTAALMARMGLATRVAGDSELDATVVIGRLNQNPAAVASRDVRRESAKSPA
jgi:release factor glutamine methyltransferase